jgi:hypothetical protein
MSAAPASEGRPVRVFLLLGLGLGVWVMLRLPILQRDVEATRATLHGDPEALAVAPRQQLTLASVAGGPDNALAIAEAEVEVAAAELALAQARLRLLRARRGEVLAPLPPPPMLQAAPAYAAVAPPAPYRSPAPRRAVARSDDIVPDYGYALPKAPAGTRQVAATATPKPVAKAAPAAGESAGYQLATDAYARLAAGDRREAAALFDAALATPADGQDAEQRALWLAERRRLGKRWRGEIYSLFRDGGQVGPTASPVLGGGQTGINIGWTYDPLARRPISAIARFNTASSSAGSPDNRTSQAAFGVEWQPVRGLSVAAERLVRVGEFARNDWNLRLAGGTDGRVGRIEWNGYGEGGVLGSGELYGGAQLRGGVPVFALKQARLVAGAGAWGGVQTVKARDGSFALGRLDLGPTLVLRAPVARTNVELSADWRFRVAGGAFPGSGPAVTLSTGF